MIDFLDELGNFKQKIFTLQIVRFYILKCQGRTTQPLLWFVLAICMCYFWIWCTCVLFLPWYYGCKKICLDLSAQKYIIICIPWRLARLRWYKKLLQRRIPILCQNTSNNRKTSPRVHLGCLGSSSNSIKQSDSDIWKKRSIYLSSLGSSL